MLKLAYFSPLPPAPTGIADYSQDLIEPLSQRCHLTLFARQPASVDGQIRRRFRVEPTSSYPGRRWEFDLALYHMGNSGYYHQEIYDLALRYPGIVVLHEVFLPDFMAHVTLGRGDYAAYAREMGYELGAAGYQQAWRIRLGRRSGPEASLRFSQRLVDRCLGLIVHSHSAAGLIQGQAGRPPVAVAPQLVASQEAKSLRPELGLPEDTVIFATTGLVNASKRLDLALDALARLRQELPNVYFLVVGGAHADTNVPRLIRQRGLQDSVHWTGRVASLAEFGGWTAAADVVLTLRHPTLGEASNAAVRALAAGKPLIVYDDGWYGELPGEVCLQVPPLDQEALLAAMATMVRQPERRRAMGRAAAAYAQETLDPARVAGHYVRFLAEVLDAVREPSGANQD